MINQILLKSTDERTYKRLRKILDTHLGGQKAKVYLFGSRAIGDEHRSSDIDLAIQSTGKSRLRYSQIKEAFHESHIPYKVELVNFDNVNKELRKNIMEEGILIWEN